jgi:hypothetical protein
MLVSRYLSAILFGSDIAEILLQVAFDIHKLTHLRLRKV